MGTRETMGGNREPTRNREPRNRETGDQGGPSNTIENRETWWSSDTMVNWGTGRSEARETDVHRNSVSGEPIDDWV